MADYAIHEETLIAQANILRKKFGTSDRQDPADYADKMNLMGVLEEKTASGAIASFSDGADDVPLKSGVFSIVPSGGGGTPSSPVPIVGRSGMTISHCGKNLCNPSDIGNYAISGTDGSISSNANSLANYDKIPVGTNSEISVSCGDYCDVRGIYCYGVNDSFLGRPGALGETNQMTRTLVSGTTHIRVTFRKHGGGAVSPSDLTNAQIEFGSSSTSYEPYSSATHAVSFGSTVYGGEYSMDGGLTVTDTIVVYDGSDDETWVYNTSGGYNRFYIDLADGLIPESGRDFVLSNRGEYGTQAGSEGLIFRYRTSTPSCRLYYYPPQTIDNVSDFRTWLSNNNLEVVYPLATPTETAIDPTPINSRLGANNLWCDTGDSEIEYRSSGTQTIIQPTLISKTITENGTYSASDEGANGYDEVTVNVVQNIETVLSSNPLIEVTGVSGTDVARTMWTYTASASGKIVFHANTTVKTNTGANDGYFAVKKNDTVIATTYANTSTTTAFPISDIEIEAGDVVTIIGGFDNYHTSCWFDIYSTITILTDAPTLNALNLSNSNTLNALNNELENELENDKEEVEE